MAPQDERLMDTDDEAAGPAPRRPAAPRKPYLSARDRGARQDDRVAGERRGEDREFSEDRELTHDDVRLEAFRNSRAQSVLPDLPTFPGYHVCWLTTSNPRDSVAMRQRLGYELIRVEECPGWDGLTGVKEGRIPGVVGIEEMVAARLPLPLFNEYMAINHSQAPRDEEDKLLYAAESLAEQAERMGSSIREGNGLETLRTRAPRPKPMTE